MGAGIYIFGSNGVEHGTATPFADAVFFDFACTACRGGDASFFSDDRYEAAATLFITDEVEEEGPDTAGESLETAGCPPPIAARGAFPVPVYPARLCGGGAARTDGHTTGAGRVARALLDDERAFAEARRLSGAAAVAGDRGARRSSRGRRVSVLAGGRGGRGGAEAATGGASWGARWFARAVREVAAAQAVSVFSPRAEAIAHGNAGLLAVDGAHACGGGGGGGGGFDVGAPQAATSPGRARASSGARPPRRASRPPAPRGRAEPSPARARCRQPAAAAYAPSAPAARRHGGAPLRASVRLYGHVASGALAPPASCLLAPRSRTR